MPRPDEVLDKNDPGDDMQRRLRFQAARAVMLSLSILDDAAEVEEIFCEQYEDVLIKKRDGRFIGEQVKTKFDESGPHKAIDEEVTRSIQRFVSLEKQYGIHFEAYVLGSNAGFWDEDKTTSSLPYLKRIVEEAKNDVAPKKLLDYLNKVFPKPKVIRGKAKSQKDISTPQNDLSVDGTAGLLDWEADIELGVKVFKKLRLETLPSMRDMRSALIEMLPKFPVIGDRLFSELGSIADACISDALKAAALAHDTARDRYLSVFSDPARIEKDEILRGKCIDRERLLTILRLAQKSDHELCTSDTISVDGLPRGMGKLELKMNAGGLSISNIGLAKDQKASTEFMLVSWLHRNGKESTDRRYRHLRTLVRSECQEAHDACKVQGQAFGNNMLNAVRQRLRERFDKEKEQLYGAKYEHLLGMAGILTEDCYLWWSDEFNVDKSTET